MEDRRNRGETYDHKRLPSRPLVSGGTMHAVNGAAFEDLGTSLQAGSSRTTVNGGSKNWGQSSSQVRSTAGQAQKFKPAPSRQPSPMPKSKYLSGQNAAGNRGYAASRSTSKKPTGRSNSVVDLDSDLSSSTDPMDLFSQPDYDVDPSTSQKPFVNHGKFKPAGSTTAAKSGQKSSSAPKNEDKKALEKKEKESQEVYIDANGERHEYHPSFLPKKGKFAGMKISKNKMNHDESSQDASLPVSKSQEPISKENLSSKAYEPPRWADSMPGPSNRKKQEAFMDLTSPPKYAEDDSIAYVKHPSPLSGKSANSNRRLSPSPPRSRQPMLSRKPTTSENLAENTRFGPPKGRPMPRPIGRAALNAAEKGISQSKQASQGPGSSQTRGGLSLTKALDVVPVGSFYGWGESAKKRPESRGRSRSRSVSLECSSPKTIRKTKLEEFPVLSPPSSPPKPSAFPMMSPLRGAEPSPPPPKRSTMKRLASPSRVPSALPMPLPKPRHQDESKAKTHVKPSKANADKGKGKAKETSRPSDEDDDDMDSDYGKKNKKQSRQRKPKLKAFPMSTQVLASIGSSPSSSSQPFASRPGKRTSEGGSDDERVSKKFRMGRDSLLESPSRLPFEDEGDSLCIAPHVDPSTLCPYCDTALPSNPTPLLVKILAATRKKSQRDSRPSNPLGLKAPLATFIAVCQRHRFESQILPEAERKGWPKTIEWKEVSGRVLKMKPFLKALIEDPGDEFLAGAADNSWEVVYEKKNDGKKKKKGPKARSIFWTDVMDEVKKKGLKAISGVRGQFANFEKTQPGYYGELGSVIIHQTLYNMFPPSKMDPALIAPLTSNEIVQRILVPEVALHLIMEDMDLEGEEGMEEALEILRDSSSYGVAMFPEDGGEWGGKKRGDDDKMGVGDLIVMERARKRRKELEEEDEREEEERRLLEEQQRREGDPMEKDKQKKKSGKQKPEPAGDSSEAAERPRPRPRPRPLAKGSSSKSLLTGQELDYEPHRRSDRSMTRSRSRGPRIGTSYRASSEEMRRSPSASASRKPEDMPPDPNTRAASRGLAGLSIGTDSDTSSKAVVNAERRGRSRSRARSTSVYAKRKEQSSDRMDTAEDDESDDEVEFVGMLNEKTSVQKRTQGVEISDGGEHESTPKAASGLTDLRPLEIARRRAMASKKQDTGFRGPFVGQRSVVPDPRDMLTVIQNRDRVVEDQSTNSNRRIGTAEGAKGRSPRDDENSWLLSDPSSQ